MVDEIAVISSRVQRMQPSATLEVADQVRALKAKGVHVIDLGLGEPDFITPERIRNAATRAMNEGFTKYSPIAGFPQLRQAVADHLRHDFELPYSASQVVITNGAKQALFNALFALLNPADEVIIPAPYWVTYPQQVELLGGVSRIVRTMPENRFRVTPTQIEEEITPRTKILILNSPSNPTGVAYDRETLEKIADILADHPHVMVISDDIYGHLLYDDRTPCHIGDISPDLFSRVVTIGGMSKAYAMTGWRIGYAAGPVEIISAMISIQSQVTSGANSIAQMASVTALKEGAPDREAMKREFEVRRNLGYELLSQIKELSCLKPDGAFYFFPDCSSYFGKEWKGSGRRIESSNDLCHYLLQEAGVAVVAGEPFGAPNHIRISYAANLQTLRDGIARMGEALALLA